MAFKAVLPRKGSRPSSTGEFVMVAGQTAVGPQGAPKLRVSFSTGLVERLGWRTSMVIFLEHDPDTGRVRFREAKGQEQGFHLFIPKKSSAPRLTFAIPGLPNVRRPSMPVPHEVVNATSLIIKIPDWAIAVVKVPAIRAV